MGFRSNPLLRFSLFIEHSLDRLMHAARGMSGARRRLFIDSYHGIGNYRLLVARGRVLAVRSGISAQAQHSPWRNLKGNLTRFLSREIPHAEVLARYGNREVRVQADSEGYFEARLLFPEGLPTDRQLFRVELVLLAPAGLIPVEAVADVSVPPPDIPFGIISDIDDTIMHTGSLRVWEMAKAILFRNAHTRLPLPGITALFRGLHGMDSSRYRPLYCVSSSPWNFHDLFAEFFTLRGFPVRPVLFLRDWGLGPEGLIPSSHRSHKLEWLRHIFEITAPLPYILLGDSAQEDPEVYRDIVEAYPGRVLAAYIRNVNKDLKRPEAIRRLAVEVLEKGSALVLARDSLAIAEHAFSKGWIGESDLSAIRAEIGAEKQDGSEVARGLTDAKKVTGPVPEAVAEVRRGGIEEALETEQGKPPAAVVVESREQG